LETFYREALVKKYSVTEEVFFLFFFYFAF